MLKQLDRLSVEVDGRYATPAELRFLKDYFDSVEERITVYEKIRDAESKIVQGWDEAKQNYPEDLMHMGSYDMSAICKRDETNILRCTASTMLFDDLDRLKEGMLVWYETIAKAFAYKKYANINYRLIQEVIKGFLHEKEAALVLPIFQLERTVIGS